MILTLNKNRTHKSRPNRHLFSAFFYLVNDYVFGGQFVGGRTAVKGTCKNRLNLTTEDENDKKMVVKDKEFGGLNIWLQAQ
jgi:hypothetical protein